MEFSFLWSLFEAETLDTNASAAAIVALTKQWHANGLLTEDTFVEQLAYFRNRYCPEGEFTHHFAHLHLRPTDQPDTVARVLQGGGADRDELAAALLIIAYRFRNNLFHGVKWAYGIKGQLENFRHASALLTRAIELHQQSAE